MIKEATADYKNVEVDYTTGLTVDYAKKHGVKHLIRGLRAVTDFEYEFQLAVANEFADKDIDDFLYGAWGH
jgi:pantetheine-phosphate adenylyltransferase